jgi:hypothetical protein
MVQHFAKYQNRVVTKWQGSIWGTLPICALQISPLFPTLAAQAA